jgi:acetyl esterase/lipase
MREIGFRKELQAFEAEAAATPGTSCITLKIPMRDGFESEALIFKYHSSAKDARRPLVILSFGGAFCFGSRYQLAPQSRAIAKATGAVVVNISYRLAPEHKFPTGPNDVWDSVKWLAGNAACEAIGADLSAGFVVGGGSAGANLTMTTIRRSIVEELQPRITGTWLSVPYLLVEDESVPSDQKHLFLSREQNSDAPFLKTADLAPLKKYYAPIRDSPDWAVMRDPQFSAWPRTYIQVAGLDPLRDDGLVLQRCLEQHGVETKLDIYPGMPHILLELGTTQNIKACEDVVAGIKWLL